MKKVKEATLSTATKNGSALTNTKKIYKRECLFRFKLSENKNVRGYHLWIDARRPGELHKDHMYSIEDGWKNKVNPKIISHPANCEIMPGSQNVKKNSKSSITLEELLNRIEDW